ncbi:MAG: DUF5011 domain-containing protein [Gammaproteobacteria bacterium]|nr:DUF5011 domain-containing protein [Gammaproteobacteria bacterium]
MIKHINFSTILIILSFTLTACGGSKDTTAPVITLNGDSSMTVEHGATYTEPGAMVTDNVDTGLTATITGTVDTTTVGDYQLTYNAIDGAGNQANEVIRTVTVVDATAPVIALIGDNPMTVVHGTTYTEPGATVTDNVDTGLTATVTGTVDTSTVGEYELTYNVTDAAGNAAIELTRSVNVVDTTAPVITLNGDNPMTIEHGSTYTEPGATVTDNVDTNLVASITGTVDTSTLGSYEITYNITDTAGNVATAVTRTVTVVKITGETLANLTGFSYFPKYNVISEISSINVSGSSSSGDITDIQVNGTPVTTADNYNNWTVNIQLTTGDNNIAIDVETSTHQYETNTTTVRYNGVIQRGSTDVVFDGNNSLLFMDNVRDAPIEHELSTGFQKVLSSDKISGLPNYFDNSIFAADENYLYLGGYLDEDRLIFQLYKISRETMVATLLASSIFPDVALPLFRPTSMQVIDNGQNLFITNTEDGGAPAQFLFVDTSSGVRTLITDANSFIDDDVYASISTGYYDEASSTIYFNGRDVNTWPSYKQMYKIELVGGNANRIQKITTSSTGDCIPFTDLNSNYFGFTKRPDNEHFLLAKYRNLYDFDSATSCITLLREFDIASIGGLAVNEVTNEIYLGFYATAAKYNLVSDEVNILETRGFSDDHSAIANPDFFDLDQEGGVIYMAGNEEFARFDINTGEVTQKITMTEDLEHFNLDVNNQRLYFIHEENGSIGYFDLTQSTYVYTELINNNSHSFGNLRFYGLTLGQGGKLYLLDSDDVIYTLDIATAELTLLSANPTSGVTMNSSKYMVFDHINNRLIAYDKLNNTLRFTAIDIATGAREVIYDGNETGVEDIQFIYGLDFDDANQTLYFTKSSNVYKLDLNTDELTIVVEEDLGDSNLADLTDIRITDDGLLYVSDNDVNGFWMINPQTNDRLIIQ